MIRFLVFSIFISTVTCLDVNCEFGLSKWEVLGEVYTCDVKNLMITEPNQNVTGIFGTHLPGKSNADVKKLNIADQTCLYLPNDFNKFFPNLEGLRVAQSGLVSLSQSDLSVFPKLINCDMFNNYLQTLSEDLFEKNPLIVYLYFGDNRIKEIGYDVFRPLKNLKKAVFQGNVCIKSNADDSNEVASLQKKINDNCVPNKKVIDDLEKKWTHDEEELRKFLEEIEDLEEKYKKQEEILKKHHWVEEKDEKNDISSTLTLWFLIILASAVFGFATLTFFRNVLLKKKLVHSQSLESFFKPNETEPPAAVQRGEIY